VFTNKQEELAHITKQIIKIQIIGAPGTIMFGLALYAIFGANGDAFHPLLNDMNIVYTLLGVGLLIMVWEFVIFLKLLGKKTRLQAEIDKE